MSDTSFKDKTIAGIKWNAVSMSLSSILQFLTVAILTRILQPEEFGVLAIILVIISLGQLLSDFGLGNAVIQKKEISHDQLSSTFWTSVLFGTLISIGLIVLRPLVSYFFPSPLLNKYLLYGAFLCGLAAPGQFFKNLLIKNMDFKKLFFIDVGGMIIYSMLTIFLAWAGFNILSVIIGETLKWIYITLFSILLFRNRWMPKWHLNFKEITGIIKFGFFQTAEYFVNFLTANLDYIFIGHYLGNKQLGFYALAYQIAIFPLSRVNPIITKVALPAFSRAQDNNELMRLGYRKALKYISIVNFSVLFFLVAFPSDFIRFFFGPNWGVSGGVLQILCFVGIFKSIGNPCGLIYLAKGKPFIGFYITLFYLFILFLSFWFFGKTSIYFVALIILFLQAPMFYVCQRIVNRLIDFKFKDVADSVRTALLGSMILLLLLGAAQYFLSSLDLSVRLVLNILLYIICYPAIVYLIDKETFLELRHDLIKK